MFSCPDIWINIISELNNVDFLTMRLVNYYFLNLDHKQSRIYKIKISNILNVINIKCIKYDINISHQQAIWDDQYNSHLVELNDCCLLANNKIEELAKLPFLSIRRC
jgi:hypothetical protein